MKRFLGLLLIIGAAFFLAGCNDPTKVPPVDNREADDLDLTFPTEDGKGQLFTITDTDPGYPGIEIELQGEILDISKYSAVIVDATLYSDADGVTKSVASTGDDESLAQFKLLSEAGGSNWADASKNVCAENKIQYNMAIDGSTALEIPDGSKGVPKVLLIQANYEKNPNAVKSIKVRKISFVAKSSGRLDHVFGESVTVDGNKIIFDNASYSNTASGNNWDGKTGVGGAALYIFPAKWGVGFDLSGTVTFNFTIEPHTCTSATGVTEVEHQLHIQAAQNTSEKNFFNGQEKQQKYITLDDAKTTGYVAATGTGSFKVSLDDLVQASQASGKANDYEGPFVLDAVRIVNNGTKWDETDVGTHYRCKSYTLVITSVTK